MLLRGGPREAAQQLLAHLQRRGVLDEDGNLPGECSPKPAQKPNSCQTYVVKAECDAQRKKALEIYAREK